MTLVGAIFFDLGSLQGNGDKYYLAGSFKQCTAKKANVANFLGDCKTNRE